MNSVLSFFTLAHRECGEETVNICWDQRSSTILGRISRNGVDQSADVYGIPRRRVAMEELSTVKDFFATAAMRVSGDRIEVWPRLLGGAKSEEDNFSLSEELKKKKFKDLLLDVQGLGKDPALKKHYFVELDRRFELYEGWARGTNSDDFCQARIVFLLIAERMDENTNVFIRAMNGLIHTLENDLLNASTSENLKKVYDALWKKIKHFDGESIVKLEKLTRAFGLAQTALIEHYRANYLAKSSQKKKKEGTKIDIKTEIFQRAQNLEKCIKGKNHVAIKYNLKCIEEGTKRLKTTESRKWHRTKGMLKPAWKGASKAANSINISIIPVINVSALLEAPIVFGKEAIKLTRNPYYRPQRDWYEKCVKQEEERDKITDWHWHYAIIGHIKETIQNGEDETLKEQATQDLISYVQKGRKTWKKTPEEIKIRLYQVLWELENSTDIPTIKPILDKLEKQDATLKERAKESTELTEQDMKSKAFWRNIKRATSELVEEGPKSSLEEIETSARQIDQVSLNKRPIICIKEPVGTFTGREAYLAELQEALRPVQNGEKTKVVILTGLSGTGKTQLARKFLSENFASYSIVYTFNAQSVYTLKDGYRDLAYHRLKIDMMTNPSPSDFRNGVNATLEEKEHSGWLLFFENVDDRNMLQFLHENCPNSGGCIFIASRVGTNWDGANIIKLREFDPSDSTKLLKTIIREERQSDQKTLAELAEALGGLPLALAQTGAYINKQAEGYNAARYLTSFRKNYNDPTIPFRKFEAGLGEKIVTTTWSSSRECIKKNCPLAYEVLCLFSFLNFEKIPTHWIERWLTSERNIDEEVLEDNFTDIITILSDGYLMIRLEGSSLSIHRLLQQVIRESLTEKEQKKSIAEALNLIKERFDRYDNEDPGTWGIGEECLPHAENITNYVQKYSWPKDSGILYKTGVLLHLMGMSVFRQGIASQSKKYCEEALRIYKDYYEDSHPEFAKILNNLGTTWSDLGEHEEAIEYFKQARKIYNDAGNRYSADLALTLNNLGLTLSASNKHRQALEYFEKARTTYVACYSSKHPDVVTALNNLGFTKSFLNNPKEAIEYFEQALGIYATYSDNNTRLDLAYYSLIGLGMARDTLNQKKKATDHYQHALRILECFPSDRCLELEMTRVLIHLGNVRSDLGKYEKAIECFKRALEIFQNHPEYDNHPDRASILSNLGVSYSDLDKYEKAIEYFEQALRIFQACYENNHPEVTSTREKLNSTKQKIPHANA